VVSRGNVRSSPERYHPDGGGCCPSAGQFSRWTPRGAALSRCETVEGQDRHPDALSPTFPMLKGTPRRAARRRAQEAKGHRQGRRRLKARATPERSSDTRARARFVPGGPGALDSIRASSALSVVLAPRALGAAARPGLGDRGASARARGAGRSPVHQRNPSKGPGDPSSTSSRRGAGPVVTGALADLSPTFRPACLRPRRRPRRRRTVGEDSPGRDGAFLATHPLPAGAELAPRSPPGAHRRARLGSGALPHDPSSSTNAAVIRHINRGLGRRLRRANLSLAAAPCSRPVRSEPFNEQRTGAETGSESSAAAEMRRGG